MRVQSVPSYCILPNVTATAPCPLDIDLLGQGFDLLAGAANGNQILTLTIPGSIARVVGLSPPQVTIPVDCTTQAINKLSSNSVVLQTTADLVTQFLGEYGAQVSAANELKVGVLTSVATEAKQTSSMAFVSVEQVMTYFRVNLAIIDSGTGQVRLTPSFQTQLNALPQVYSQSTYVNFIKVWGTHVVTALTYGVDVELMASVGSCDISSHSSAGVSAYFAAEVDVSIGISANTTVVTTYSNHAAYEAAQWSVTGGQLSTCPSQEDCNWQQLLNSVTAVNLAVIGYTTVSLDALVQSPTLSTNLAQGINDYFAGLSTALASPGQLTCAATSLQLSPLVLLMLALLAVALQFPV